MNAPVYRRFSILLFSFVECCLQNCSKLFGTFWNKE